MDIKALLNRLDSDSRGLLEQASAFCLQHRQSEVAVEHYLLQMLDVKNSPLNRLMEKTGVDGRVWIKQLLILCEKYQQKTSARPIFSSQLLDWFELASAEADNNADDIQVKDLIVSLLRNPALYTRCGLAELDRGAIDLVDALLDDTSGQEPSTATASVESIADDATMLFSNEELEESATIAIGSDDNSGLDITGYDNLLKIGEGGMASVYRAVHTGLEREVALKILRPGSGADADFAARFLREARIVAKLAHPNIIQIYDVNQVNGNTYIAMELIAGGELSDRLDSGFSLGETVRILSQVLAALQSAHDKGFIHRDIKPANILFRDDDSVVLTDFGIARVIGEDSDLTIDGSVLGTPRYMSPEQARGDKLDHRSDLYSVGIIFYQMLEQKLPYVGESAMGTAMKHIMDPIPELSAEWMLYQGFLDQALAKDPNQRFQSGAAMIAALEAIESNEITEFC